MTSNDMPGDEHTPEEERAIREAALDRTVESSFPASDPPSTIPDPYDHDALPEVTPRHVSALRRRAGAPPG